MRLDDIKDPKLRERIVAQMNVKASPQAQRVAITPSKRIRQSSKPLLNKLETRWLAVLNNSFPNADIRCQAKTYRLANGLRYTPDFTAMIQDENNNLTETAWEVKGKWVDGDSFPKLKMAASVWPKVRWILVYESGGCWKEEIVLP